MKCGHLKKRDVKTSGPTFTRNCSENLSNSLAMSVNVKGYLYDMYNNLHDSGRHTSHRHQTISTQLKGKPVLPAQMIRQTYGQNWACLDQRKLVGIFVLIDVRRVEPQIMRRLKAL